MQQQNSRLLAVLRAAEQWLAGKLARVTSSGEVIPEIDGLRFLAIAAVVFHHLVAIYLPASGRGVEVRTYAEWFDAARQSWLVVAAYCGHFGVHLFFVISGFILALPFARRAFAGLAAPDLKSYYLRRLTRIEPPYVLSLLLIYFVHCNQSSLGSAGEAARLFPHLLASLFYAHGLVFGEASKINGVTWSLEIEIQFYLLVPLLVQIFRVKQAVRRRALLLGLIVGGGLLSEWVIYPSGSARLPLSLLNFFHYFLAGFLLADFYLTGELRRADKRVWWDVVTVAAAAALFGVLIRFGQFYFLLPLLVALLYAGFFLGRAANALIRLRWLVIVGGMCYTLYLYHVIIIANLTTSTIQAASAGRPFMADFLLQCLLICPVLLVLCGWLFVFTEKPFMRWSLSARPAAQAATAD